MEKNYKELCTNLKRSLKSKTVLRETLHHTAGHKLKEVDVSYIDKGWYHFKIDGYEFDCKWNSLGKTNSKYNKPTFTFRNNDELKRVFGEYEIDADRISNASSLYFGGGSSLIPILWVFGEVMSKKNSWEHY